VLAKLILVCFILSFPYNQNIYSYSLYGKSKDNFFTIHTSHLASTISSHCSLVFLSFFLSIATLFIFCIVFPLANPCRFVITVTWDSGHWSDPSTSIRIKVKYIPDGWTAMIDSIKVPAGRGYYPWTVSDLYLQGRSSKSLELMIEFVDAASNETKTLNGPQISVIRDNLDYFVPTEAQNASSSSRPILAIVLPVVFVVLALAIGGWFLWRRYREKLVIAGIRRRSSQGYGVRKSHSQRISSSTKSTSIQLDDSPRSPNPQSGRNYFRDELERQERARA
jgi:hypothetical protein